MRGGYYGSLNMSNMRRYLFALLALILSITLSDSNASLASALYASQIESLVPKEARNNGKLGVVVRSLTTGETIFEHNPQKLFIPASNGKIVTSVAALALLGNDYRFKTEFYSGGVIREGVLYGGLYVKGYGDPTFAKEHLDSVASYFKRIGIKSIKGGIILDDSYFSAIRYPKGWKEGWKKDFYGAPISALSYNYNVIELKISSSTTSSKPKVEIVPMGANVSVINKVLTSRKGGFLKATWQNRRTILLKGKVKSRSSFSLKLPAQNPTLFTGDVIRSALARAGIKVEGHLIMGAVPTSANLFYTHYSETLSSIMTAYNKNSINIIGENIIKALGAERKGAPGTWDKGSESISEFLNEVGIKNGFKIVDGSGLSLENRMSPEVLTDVLSYAYRNLALASIFIDSLPIAGVDGTLEKRFRATEIKGRVRAKTGYLKNVRTLSGYVFTKQGDVLAFSILANGLGVKTKEFQRNLLSKLTNCC